MPILDQAVEDLTPDLLQGDLLKTCVHFTDALSGKPSIAGDCQLGMVVSRDCIASQKGRVLVAPVSPWTAAPKPSGKLTEEAFERYEKQLRAARDGSASPDRFVLGSLAGSDEILVARLDEISTLVVPKEQEALRNWVRSARLARLSPEFRRALPTRLFWALCRGTFDDHTWLCTSDLSEIVRYGDEILVTKPDSPSLREKLEPYRVELSRRLLTRPGTDAR